MTHPTLPIRQRLQHQEFLQFNRHQALRLQADSGSLWVTVDGEIDDIEINAGSSRVFDGHATVTVGTFSGDALLVATPLTAPGWLPRLLARVGGWRLVSAHASQSKDVCLTA